METNQQKKVSQTVLALKLAKDYTYADVMTEGAKEHLCSEIDKALIETRKTEERLDKLLSALQQGLRLAHNYRAEGDTIKNSGAAKEFEENTRTVIAEVQNEEQPGNSNKKNARERESFCPSCNEKTTQHPTFFNADNPTHGEIWTYSICYEGVEFLNEPLPSPAG